MITSNAHTHQIDFFAGDRMRQTMIFFRSHRPNRAVAPCVVPSALRGTHGKREKFWLSLIHRSRWKVKQVIRSDSSPIAIGKAPSESFSFFFALHALVAAVLLSSPTAHTLFLLLMSSALHVSSRTRLRANQSYLNHQSIPIVSSISKHLQSIHAIHAGIRH